MDMPINQISSDTLIPIEQHFKIAAGPGAGKTHWLVNHIKNVLHTSGRLGKSRKIACITYTNIGVETILRRLNTSIEHLEVSTIHSLLYRHIVKPYASLIAAEYNLNVKNLDGHDEHIVSSSKIRTWIKADYSSLSYLFSDNNLTRFHLGNLRWNIESDELKLKITKRRGSYKIKKNKEEISIPFISEDKQGKLLAYKKLYWSQGIIHHDDVLFFSHQLIQKFPFILDILRAKFPYFFLDEFQDTNPIQTKIIEMIGQNETIIGVIGDKAQSIFEFQGAVPVQFDNFTLPDMLYYQMADNRRSSNQIIDFLNNIREDIVQNKFRNQEGKKPIIIIGDMVSALKKAKELCNGEEVCSLSYDNITVNAMKRCMDQNIPNEDLLETLRAIDSNSDRKKLIIACIKSTKLARQNRFKEAIKELERIFRDRNDKSKGKKAALKHILTLLKHYNEYKDKTLTEYREFINREIDGIAALNKGNTKKFYDDHSYQQLAVYVNIIEDASLHRTIHKAKGAEFNNVLLILKDEEELESIYKPNFDEEDHRLYYVAMSRAKENLFITVPAISKKSIEERLEFIGATLLRI